MPSIHNDCLFFSHLFWVSLVTQTVKNLTTMRETWIRSLGQGNGNPFLPGEFHGQRRREWQPIPVFLPGEFHGQRSLAGYSPWGCKESHMTEQLTHNIQRAETQFIFQLISLHKSRTVTHLHTPLIFSCLALWNIIHIQHAELSIVKVAQSHQTVCDPKDYTVHGILQARILEWVAVPFSRGSS